MRGCRGPGIDSSILNITYHKSHTYILQLCVLCCFIVDLSHVVVVVVVVVLVVVVVVNL